ncbi:hypothetical protein theurythT_07390 [Thalassotalea eurytherma]|uniref:Uncharacterized protein n=2 Tax=Thalassotalea eurytherma TaxID=1144278 RepID=A0ABQ6H395_9GAMM|nr:hypothetical protein theurythT_07390 [Thalassotalea eurytherma]
MLKNVAKKMLGKNSAPLANYEYFIDVIGLDAISGWAKNNTNLSHTPIVSVHSGGQQLWQGTAELEREDLTQAGIGERAFHIFPDTSVLEGDITHIDIYIDGHKANDMPYPFKASKNQVAEQAQAVEPVVENVIADSICQIDAVTNERVVGWAKSKTNDSKRLTIEFKNGEQVLASGVANNYRSDLVDAGIGDGSYGFEFGFDLPQFDSPEVAAELYIDGVAAGGEPFVFSVDAKDIEDAKFKAQFAEQFAEFSAMSAAELNRITAQVNELSKTAHDQSMNVAINVALQNIAEISARISVIEKILIKKLS